MMFHAYVRCDTFFENDTAYYVPRSATFPGMKIAELFGVEPGPLREEMEHNILHLNGEPHTRLRKLVNPAFTPRAADRHREAMRGFLAELMPASPTDFVEAVAKPY